MHTIGMTMNKIKIQQKVEMCRFNLRHVAIFIFLLIPLGAWPHGISDEDKQRMLDGGYLQYIELGATHMLTGYDHLLFLLGVVFFLTRAC